MIIVNRKQRGCVAIIKAKANSVCVGLSSVDLIKEVDRWSGAGGAYQQWYGFMLEHYYYYCHYYRFAQICRHPGMDKSFYC